MGYPSLLSAAVGFSLVEDSEGASEGWKGEVQQLAEGLDPLGLRVFLGFGAIVLGLGWHVGTLALGGLPACQLPAAFERHVEIYCQVNATLASLLVAHLGDRRCAS